MKVYRRPDDKVFTLSHRAAKEGEPIVLGPHETILSTTYEVPYFYLIIRCPWDLAETELIDGQADG